MAYTNSDDNNTHFLGLQIYSDFCPASCILTQRNQKSVFGKKYKIYFPSKKKKVCEFALFNNNKKGT